MSDFDRPLNERGERDAPEMGKRLRSEGIHPDLVISSPAVRALTTCQVIAAKIGYALDKIVLDKRIYHADEDQLLELIRDFPEVKTVMLFGHNPGFTDFANRLLDAGIDNLSTCGIIGGKLDIKKWKDASWRCGSVIFMQSPKD